MTNALYALALSRSKPISLWSTLDVDEILLAGNNMYLETIARRRPCASGYLQAEELPKQVCVRSSVCRPTVV